MELCKEKKNSVYSENVTLLRRAQEGDEEATEELCRRNGGLVRSIAMRFLGRGTEYEDLIQLGNIGMLRAIRTFDEGRGCAFSTYAVPLIMGEIKRFLRDDGLVKVGREQKRIGAAILSARERYISAHGIDPPISELAREVGVSSEEASLALEAVSPVTMLSDPVFDDERASVEHTLTDESEGERTFDRIALSDAISRMPALWRQIVVCRYFRDMSQQSTADLLSLTQVKISREEKKLLAYLRSQME